MTHAGKRFGADTRRKSIIMLPRYAFAAGDDTVKAAGDINDPVSCSMTVHLGTGDRGDFAYGSLVSIIWLLVNANDVRLGIKKGCVSSNNVRVDTKEVLVGSNAGCIWYRCPPRRQQ